ncbi:MAG: hypothetical protein ACKO9B_07670 [Planctomycetota bacterium]
MASDRVESRRPAAWAWSLVAGAVALFTTAPAMAAPWASLKELTDTQVYHLTSTLKVTAVSWLGRTSLPGAAGLTHVAMVITNSGPRPATVRVLPATSYDHSPVFSIVGMLPDERIPVGAGMTVRTDLFADGWSQGGGLGVVLNTYVEQTTLKLAWSVNYGTPATSTDDQRRVAVITKELATPEGRAACIARLGWTEDDVVGLVNVVDHGPADWRGWTPLTDIALSASDWSALSAATREGLVQWAALGGRAVVLGRGRPPTGLPSPETVGAGSVVYLDLDDPDDASRGGDTGGTNSGEPGKPSAYPLEPQTPLLITPLLMWKDYGYAPSGTMIGDAGIGWSGRFSKLPDVFGPRGLPIVALLAFVVVLGVLAGPVNILLLARPPRRSRIFATTPLVSLAATALLLVLMFLRDGTGGAGVRRPLCLLLPEQKAMAVIQEEFSRTGVLLGTDIPLAERSWMRPVGLTHRATRFVEDNDGWRRGDWFHGRSDQGYVLQAIRPSRGRIDLVGTADDGTPTLVSSIDVILERVVYRDREGRVWTNDDLPADARRALHAATDDDWKKARTMIDEDAGPLRERAIRRATASPGTVIAIARDAGDFAIQTHPSIRWRDERVAFVGPCSDASVEPRP